MANTPFSRPLHKRSHMFFAVQKLNQLCITDRKIQRGYLLLSSSDPTGKMKLIPQSWGES